MDTLLGVMIGIGLAAACGFRVFVPLFVASVAGHVNPELLPLGAGFEWVTSWPAMIALGTATLLEVGAYYIPWVDNALDAVATPAAVIAGSLVTAAFLPEGMGPFLSWTTAAIVGGGSAGVVQATTVMVRGASTGTTAGLGNPAVSTAELGGSILTAFLAIFIPIVAFLLLIVCFYFLLRWLRRWLRARKAENAAMRATHKTDLAGDE
jgi:hypothetical protein